MIGAEPGELADAAARRDIEHRLDSTLFVEAGAGSGKTTSLVSRIVRLICSGRCELAELAAVTFTEAAAGELRLRVRDELAEVASGGSGDGSVPSDRALVPDDERRRARQALDHIDEAAISTIHGFCRRLLAEYPIEAGLPPRFEVMDEVQHSLSWRRQWSDALDRFGDDAGVRGLFQVASLLSVNRIPDLARRVAEEWDKCGTISPDGSKVVETVRKIVVGSAAEVVAAFDSAVEFAGECTEPSDRLSVRLEELRPYRARLVASSRWEDQMAALAAPKKYGGAVGNKAAWTCDINLVRAELDRADIAREDALQQCCDVVLPALVALCDVLAHRLADERRALGRLTYHDLLVLTRDLLAERHEVLADVRRRLRYVLVDEFQDTDPLQLEIAELLAWGTAGAGAHAGTDDGSSAGGDSAGGDSAGGPRADEQDTGRLFFVGDPNQSIYRFRGADMDAYVEARERHAGGATVSLTSNFRSVPGIIEFVNECFGSIVGEGFSRLDAVRPDPGLGASVRIIGGPLTTPKLRRFAQRELESDACARAIVQAVRAERWMVEDRSRGPAGRQRRPARLSDVAILVPRRTGLDQIESALDVHGVGYRVESASLIFRSQEVRDLLALCRAIDAPGDELALVAALRSPAFGCGDDDLFAYRAAGGRWSIEALRAVAAPEVPCAPGAPGAPSSGGDGRVGDPALVAAALGRLASYRARRRELGPVGVLEEAVRDRRLLQLAAASPRARESWRRVRFLIEQARAFVAADGGGLREFADWVEEQLSEGLRSVEAVLPEPDEDVVHILTAHGAKGLEFPITVLAGFGTTDDVSAPRGVRVLRDGDRVEVHFREKLETSGFDQLGAAEKARDREEAARVLYVAATRARDHLVFCAHHVRAATASLGERLFKAAQVAAKSNPLIFEVLDGGDISRLGEPPAHAQAAERNGAPQSHGGLAARGGGDGGVGGVPAPNSPAPAPVAGRAGDEPCTGESPDSGRLFGLAAMGIVGSSSPVSLSTDAYASWRASRAELLARIGRRSSVTATEIAALAGAAGRAVGGESTQLGQTSFHRQRQPDGIRVGRAVHMILQLIDREAAQAIGAEPSLESPELTRLVHVQARAEHIDARADEIESLVRAALSSPTVLAAFASPTLHREVYVSTRLNDVVLHGVLDMCFEDGGGLVIVDYKTDSLGDELDVAAAGAFYGLQLAAYALALGHAAGRPVGRCVLVFLRAKSGLVEYEVSDLDARVSEARAAIAGGL